ncbi:MAG TPA: hypothetical protein VK440_02520 [Burkholderiales bacterium]|nr:hypothetical protein [Burkholderiales bacterium]
MSIPVCAAIRLAMIATGLLSPALGTLAIIVIYAGIFRALIHVSLRQTELVAGIRFVFFFVRLMRIFAMGAYVAVNA